MKRTLFIHIGWHKTATSSIQQYLHDNRELLKKHDLCYPRIHDKEDTNLIKHSYLYLSILNRLQIPHLQEELPVCEFDLLFRLSVEEIVASHCSRVIISEEGLSLGHRGISELMGRYREYFDDIKIIAYLRRQDFFLEALYAQFVKQKPDKTFLPLAEFIAQEDVRRRGEYAMILEWWGREFGNENILVVPFEPARIEQDPLETFFSLTGLPGSLLKISPPVEKRVHISPPREVTDFFRHLNENKIDYFVKILAEQLVKTGSVTNTRFLCREDREKILLEYQPCNEIVARKYLKREDGILFEQPMEDYANCQETWKGLSQEELLERALPATGRMSVELSRLYYENLDLKARLSHLKAVNGQLENENLRLGSLRKSLYRFLRQRYRKLILGGNE